MTERPVTQFGSSPAVPLVNREAELGELIGALDDVIAGGPASAVLVVGACGIGKTRLVQEVVMAAKQSDVGVLRGQCIGRGAEALLPVREALSSYLGSSPDRIKEVVKSAAPQLLELVPFVGKFLVPVAEAFVTGPQLGGSSSQGVYAGLERVFHGLAERSGLCLLIEDVHEADQDTLYFLTYLVQKAAETRALALFTVDEDELEEAQLREIIDDWLVQGWKRVDVGPFIKANIAEYVAAVSGRWPSPQVVDALQELTAGNALLLQELLPLVESGTASALEVDFTKMTLPRRVQAVLNRRLSRVDKELQTFVTVAAVCLEGNADFAVVTEILKLDDDASLALLEQSSSVGLIVETTTGQVRFVHEAMRLAVYGTVPELTRRRLHGKAAEWFERAGHVSSAVHHFERAGRTADMARTSLRAGLLAEHVGMYHSAARFYEQARPYSDDQMIGPPLVRCLIMLGRWDDAEELLRRLPDDAAAVRLLWSDLHFVRGRIRSAAEDILPVLAQAVDERLACLIRLADIHLYLGEFATAGQHARDALAAAERTGSVSDHARCLGIVGATLLFAGHVDEAKGFFGEAYELLEAIPESKRDRTPYTVVLGNLGQVAEFQNEWPAAEQFHARALAIRQEVFDARGVLQSLHALARARIGMSEVERSAGPLDEAERLAASLGEPLEKAKIALTRALLSAHREEHDQALTLVEEAVRGFTECGTSFDVAHARLARAQMYAAAGDERRAVLEGATARATVERRDFGLLRRVFPDLTFSYEDRITAGLRAYAYGDAFGLPWEGSPPVDVDLERAASLPARTGWARGETSDDTALMLLVAQLITSSERDLTKGFLELLSQGAKTIKGLGPSTTEAIRIYLETGKPPTEGGRTNGAAMRALPVGWMVPITDPERRRAVTIAISRATHASPEAQCAACVMSACAAWALEGAGRRLFLEIAREEAAAAAEACGADRTIDRLLEAVQAEKWSAGPEGVTLDPYDTVSAVLACILRAESLAEGLKAAVGLGGDTDTVAALVGGLIGCRSGLGEIAGTLPWAAAVRLPDEGVVSLLGHALASARVQAVDG